MSLESGHNTNDQAKVAHWVRTIGIEALEAAEAGKFEKAGELLSQINPEKIEGDYPRREAEIQTRSVREVLEKKRSSLHQADAAPTIF